MIPERKKEKYTSEAMQQRFWSRVDKIAPSGCWLYTPYRSGHNIVYDGVRTMSAHKYAYTELVGGIPDGSRVDHNCKNKLCVNPEHLLVSKITPKVKNIHKPYTLRTVALDVTKPPEPATTILSRVSAGDNPADIAKNLKVTLTYIHRIVLAESKGNPAITAGLGKVKKDLDRETKLGYFNGKVYKEPGSSCWIWKGKPTKRGYGEASDTVNRMKAHRYSYLLNVGEIPYGCIVIQMCGNSLCVCPDHLALKDNAFSRKKIPLDTILAIRQRLANGESVSDLANEYELSNDSAYRIAKRITWADLE